MKLIDSIVYLIEDDEGSRASTECLLGVHHIQSRSFGTAEHFFSEVAEHPVGCIVTDLILPGMSGLELLQKTREMGWTIPVIVLTAFGDVATVVNAFQNGVYDFLEKPFLPDRLINGVSNCLLHGRKRTEEHRAIHKFGIFRPE